jgi:hypothetical protein
MSCSFFTLNTKNALRESLINNFFQAAVVVWESRKKLDEREVVRHEITISNSSTCCQGIRIKIAY